METLKTQVAADKLFAEMRISCERILERGGIRTFLGAPLEGNLSLPMTYLRLLIAGFYKPFAHFKQLSPLDMTDRVTTLTEANTEPPLRVALLSDCAIPSKSSSIMITENLTEQCLRLYKTYGEIMELFIPVTEPNQSLTLGKPVRIGEIIRRATLKDFEHYKMIMSKAYPDV